MAYLDINNRDVSNNIMVIVHNGQRRNALVVHKFEGMEKGFISAVTCTSV